MQVSEKIEKNAFFFQFSACVLSLANACIVEGRLFSTVGSNLGRKETLHLTWVMVLDYQTYNHVSTPLLSPPQSLWQGSF